MGRPGGATNREKVPAQTRNLVRPFPKQCRPRSRGRARGGRPPSGRGCGGRLRDGPLWGRSSRSHRGSGEIEEDRGLPGGQDLWRDAHFRFDGGGLPPTRGETERCFQSTRCAIGRRDHVGGDRLSRGEELVPGDPMHGAAIAQLGTRSECFRDDPSIEAVAHRRPGGAATAPVSISTGEVPRTVTRARVGAHSRTSQGSAASALRATPPPQTLSRGSRSRSSSRTCQPARASRRAAVPPTGPAPSTTSTFIAVGPRGRAGVRPRWQRARGYS
jgi:hypothetical protein